MYVRYQDLETETLAEAHGRLGPVVRLGPSDVSIDDIEHVKTVYTSFNRTKWYSIFDNYGVACMFSAIPAKEHALRKRMVSHVYTKTFIQTSPAVASQARAILQDRLLPTLIGSTAADQEPHGIEVFSLFLATSMDFITAHVYGLEGGTNFLRKTEYRDHWLQIYLARFGALFLRQELPGLTWILTKCGITPYSHEVTRATNELADWNLTMFNKTGARLANHPDFQDNQLLIKSRDVMTRKEFRPDSDDSFTWGRPEDKPTVMLSLLSAMDREQVAHRADKALRVKVFRQPILTAQSELFDHIIAGQETTANTLAFLTWRLSVHQEVQDILRAELLSLQKSEDGSFDSFFPDAKTLDSLPVLNAVIMETLRLHAPFEGPQPRQTPDNGCHIGPYKLPGGVRIAALAYTLHRNTSVFPDPEIWDYTRWIDSDEEAKKARNRQFWAFGSGGRMCIGIHFAMHEIKAVIAMIYSRFRTHIADDSAMKPDADTTSDEIEQLYLLFELLQ
ncbi:hypothetical protein SEUCBS139899_000208 [Sporothrix eucalyptigena]